jgi:hypothetical protein
MEVAGAPGLPGDAIPFDGIVDLTDLNNVQNSFGVSSGAQPVPEPGGAMLAAIAVVACGLRAQFGEETAIPTAPTSSRGSANSAADRRRQPRLPPCPSPAHWHSFSLDC